MSKSSSSTNEARDRLLLEMGRRDIEQAEKALDRACHAAYAAGLPTRD